MKKFPSIIKLPKHQRFTYEPRFYDPVKEDIANRKALIESSLRQERKLSETSPEAGRQYRQRIAMAYNRRGQLERKSTITQAIIVGVLIALFGLFFFW